MHLVPVALVLVGFIFAFVSLWFPPLNKWQIFSDSLKYSVPALLLYLVLVFRKEVRPATLIDQLRLVLLGVIAFPFAGALSEVALNGWLDDSVATAHTVPVIGKYADRGRRGTAYYLQVKPWRPGGEVERIGVLSEVYDRAQPYHTMITVLTKPGKFGFEWTVSSTVH